MNMTPMKMMQVLLILMTACIFTSTAIKPDFSHLMLDQQAPCPADKQQSMWSCARCLSSDQVKKRDPAHYGFHEGENDADHVVGQHTDSRWDWQMPSVPVLSSGPGYLLMDFTEELKRLLPWWEQVKGKTHQHEPIGGGFTNNNVHHFTKLNFDHYRDSHQMVQKEMKRILEWWTQTKLEHTATFGVRVYHRHAMLVNHVDRIDTHVASAVLQIAQETDPDSGWPLEVIRTDGTVCEVYLQPGQMVLYEGARVSHGRPMRFKGESFANIFSHFRPIGWNGPPKEGKPFVKKEL